MKFTRTAKYVKETIEEVCRKRGVENYYPIFTFRKIKVNEQSFHLSEINTPNPKGVIIFTPGTNAYALLYGDYLKALAALGYKVIGFDPRCHGQSSGANGSYTVVELIDDLHSLSHFIYNEEKLPLFLSGSSQGGIVSFYCAAKEQAVAESEKRKSIIQGLICHNIADLAHPSAVELTRIPELSKMFKTPFQLMARLFPEWPVSMLFYLDLKNEPVRNMGNAWEIIQSDPLIVDMVRLKTLASLSSTSLAIDVESLSTPLFLIQAGNDNIFKTAYSEWLYNRLNCPKKMIVYPDLPHYMIVDYVEEFIGDVAAWLNVQQ